MTGPRSVVTIKREISTVVVLTKGEILQAIENFVSGFDEPLTWEDIDWGFEDCEGCTTTPEITGCKIEVVTVDNGESE